MVSPIPPQAARLLDAASTCIGRVGLGKTTLDDVAREAGCSRATLYRYFPGKPALIGALVAREAGVLEQVLEARTAEAESLEDAVVAIVVTAAGWLASQPALNFVMTAEPEVVLPHLAFDGADRVLRAGARVIAPSLRRFLDGRDGGDDEYADSERAGEWLARMVLSYVSCPTDSV